MKNLDALLKARGIRKGWFIKNVLGMAPATFYDKARSGNMPLTAIQATMKHLGVTFDELTQ